MPVVAKTSHSGFKLCQKRVKLDIRGKVLEVRVEQYWNR